MNETHPFFARRWSRRQLIVFDLLAGLGFALVFFMSAVNTTELPLWVRASLPFGLGLPLAVRRLWPLPVFCFTLVLAVVTAVVDAAGFAYVSPAYAIYMVAMSDALGAVIPSSAIGVVSVITAFGLVVAGGAPNEGAPSWILHIDQPLIGIAAIGGAWTIGRAVRERRLYAARDAERLAERAVTQERLRIARELHDIVTHSVGLIAVKAGVANHVLATRPEEAHDALRVIETASRSALVEMRHLLGVLRSTPVPDLVPVPGLAGLASLAQQARQAGVEVELDVRIDGDDAGRERPGGDLVEIEGLLQERVGVFPGSDHLPDARHGGSGEGRSPSRHVPGEGVLETGADGLRDGGDRGGERLPDGVELSVYRIVQEALTNVIKHAAPARCQVSVAADGNEVRIEVTDDGAGRRTLPADGTGHGLIGMRERVMMYGGVFEAGSMPRRGFRVFARLPYREAT